MAINLRTAVSPDEKARAANDGDRAVAFHWQALQQLTHSVAVQHVVDRGWLQHRIQREATARAVIDGRINCRIAIAFSNACRLSLQSGSLMVFSSDRGPGGGQGLGTFFMFAHEYSSASLHALLQY